MQRKTLSADGMLHILRNSGELQFHSSFARLQEKGPLAGWFAFGAADGGEKIILKYFRKEVRIPKILTIK